MPSLLPDEYALLQTLKEQCRGLVPGTNIEFTDAQREKAVDELSLVILGVLKPLADLGVDTADLRARVLVLATRAITAAYDQGHADGLTKENA